MYDSYESIFVLMSLLNQINLNECHILHRDGANLIDISYFDKLETEAILSPGRFSIKYVVTGEETYKINENPYRVQSKQYILANHHFRGFVEIKKPTKGICIDLDFNIISEVLSFLHHNDQQFSSAELEVFFNSANFLDNKYDAHQTVLGNYLIELDKKFHEFSREQIHISKDLYYTLAEKLVEDHLPIYQKLQNIDAVKISTKNELYKKIQSAKQHIDEEFKSDLDMESLARKCCISEYHFFRMFKKVMAISPYQYLLQRRLKYAEEEIQSDKKNISEIALDAGFSDLFTFSKSFKKNYGISPRAYHKLYFKY